MLQNSRTAGWSSISGVDMAEIPKLPWWAAGGLECCDFCFQGYVYEVQCRCAECDRPLCPLCAAPRERTDELLCPECGCGG
jgi:hypothetical protein